MPGRERRTGVTTPDIDVTGPNEPAPSGVEGSRGSADSHAPSLPTPPPIEKDPLHSVDEAEEADVVPDVERKRSNTRRDSTKLPPLNPPQPRTSVHSPHASASATSLLQPASSGYRLGSREASPTSSFNASPPPHLRQNSEALDDLVDDDSYFLQVCRPKPLYQWFHPSLTLFLQYDFSRRVSVIHTCCF